MDEILDQILPYAITAITAILTYIAVCFKTRTSSISKKVNNELEKRAQKDRYLYKNKDIDFNKIKIIKGENEKNETFQNEKK